MEMDLEIDTALSSYESFHAYIISNENTVNLQRSAAVVRVCSSNKSLNVVFVRVPNGRWSLNPWAMRLCSKVAMGSIGAAEAQWQWQ